MRLLVAAGALLIFAACAADPEAAPTPSPTVVETPFELEEDDVEAFVDGFMDARVRGDRQTAERHLSAEAAQHFEDDEAGLVLVNDLERWELRSLEAIDATSFEVQVAIHTRDGSFEEFLFVGSGEDLQGTFRNLIVRGAARR